MEVTTITCDQPDFPSRLRQMHQTPAALYCRGRPLADIMARPRVAIVGSRRMSPYGRQITARMARELAEQGVVIVSGLAIGVDAAAHAAALQAGGITMAVLPTPVETPSPPSNQRLALQILEQGGALVSSYPADSESHKGNFVARNEIVAGLSDLVVVTEAAAGSGTLHTAQFAIGLGVPVYAVPGSIDSPLSIGTNQLIKSSNAGLITGARDILLQLGIKTRRATRPTGDTPDQQRILDLLGRGVHEGEELFMRSGLAIQQFNQCLTMLEIGGKIMPLGANRWGLP